MFADDTTLFSYHKNVYKLRENILTDLTAVSEWCELNLLTLNASKTAYLLFSSPHAKIPDSFPDNSPEREMTKTTALSHKR